MKRFYFVLRSVKNGQEYYKTVTARTLADAVKLVTKMYPSFVQVSIKELS